MSRTGQLAERFSRRYQDTLGNPAFVAVILVVMTLGTLLFMGFFIHSSLDLELNARLEKRLDMHMDTRVWHVRTLVDQGVPFPSLVQDIISQSFATEPALMRLMVLDSAGTVRYTSEGTGSRLLARLLGPEIRGLKAERMLTYNREAGWFQGVRAIPGPGGTTLGTFMFVYRVTGISPVLEAGLASMLVWGGVLVLAGLLVFFAGPPLLHRLTRGRWAAMGLPQILASWTMKRGLILLSAILGIFSLAITLTYARMVSDAELLAVNCQLRNLSSMVLQLRQTEPDYRRWGNMDAFLQELLLAQDSRHSFYICDRDGQLLWAAARDWQASRLGALPGTAGPPGRPGAGNPAFLSLDSGIEVLLAGKAGHDLIVGVIPDQTSIDRTWQSALVDLLSILAIVLMLSIEVMRLLRRQISGRQPVLASQARSLEHGSSQARFLVFLLFTALFLPAATFPQQAKEWIGLHHAAAGTWLLTLTVSAWLLGVALVSMSSRLLVRLLGFEGLATASVLLVIVLCAANLLVANVYLMLGVRLVSGIVHGCIAMIACSNENRCVMMVPAGRNRYLDIRDWNAGFASGAIVGIGSGGILGARFGLELVGLLSLALLAIILVYLARRRPFAGFVPYIAGVGAGFLRTIEPAKLLRFLGMVLLVLLPLQLATQGLFYFLFPLYMTNLGLSYADIARLLAGYGCIGLLTPVWKRIVQGYRQERMFIVASHMVCGISITAVALQQDMASLIIAALSMGVAAMLNDGISYRLVLRQPGMLDPHEDPEPWYRLADMASTAFIPLVGALLAVFLGIREAVFVIGLASLAGAVVFTIFAGYGKRGQLWS